MRSRLFRHSYLLFYSLIILVFFQSCAHAISKKMRNEVNKALTFKQVQSDPDRFIGKGVIWGGVIIETVNRKDGTYIMILQTTLSRGEKPQEAETSQGRFMVKYAVYLDSEIYKPGRKLSVAGEVFGKEIHPIGQISYTYPLLLAKELYLWKEVEPRAWRYPPPFYWHWPWYYSGWRFYPYYPPYWWW